MKKITWLHLSDIHFYPKTRWRDSQSTNSLIDYLCTEFSNGRLPRPDLIFCTGDIAFGESKSSPLKEQYKDAENFFDKLLSICGKDTALERSRLYVVPGNHDINRNSINQDAQETIIKWGGASHDHAPKINQRLEDRTTEFRQAISRLDEYSEFISNYLPHQADPEGRHCYSSVLSINDIKVGISGFNSAWTCSGPEDDRNIWLAGDWQFNNAQARIADTELRIGLIHHPIDWLNQSDRAVANKRIPNIFDFWLHGHSHDAYVAPGQTHVTVAAGAVGAQDTEEFGVNLVNIDFESGTGSAHLLTKHKSSEWTICPIPNYAPQGIWEFQLPSKLAAKLCSKPSSGKMSSPTLQVDNAGLASTGKYLERRLSESLVLFSNHNSEWIQPIIRAEPEECENILSAENISTEFLVDNPRDIIINAPPQYGLTCLAHHLSLLAFKNKKEYWLYLDSKDLKPHKDSILKQEEKETSAASMSKSDVKCVIIDSWSPIDKDGIKLLNKIYEIYEGIPVICMEQCFSSAARNIDRPVTRSPESLYLWSLPRESIRKIVSCYNDKRPIGDENAITSRIISDMDVLNLHRTPLNCLTLLKVSEIDFDESPVNRTEIIKRVLFLLFNMEDIPTYIAKPDLKDCEHVLGYLCEQLIKEGSYGFTRKRFLTEIQEHAKSQLMDLETQIVFDVLFENSIIIERGDLFYFRFSYWLFYFAAQRMHHSQDFADYILEDMRYSQHPELMEFYTGIDRRREDALNILISDLNKLRGQVHEMCGLPEELNPYRLGKWNSSEEVKRRMQQEVAAGVANSNLPDIIKDRYADKDYDRRKPYNQSMGRVLSDHSFVRLIQATTAGSRALRNSDYANLELKRDLLSEILKCWEQVSRVIFTILPILMENRSATYDGVHIVLLGEETGSTVEERFSSILTMIPSSVTRTFSDDLYSMKMGPLLYDRANHPSLPELSKHELMLLLCAKRPRDWQKEVAKYIVSIQHNSFYLYDIYINLRAQYRYAFATPKTLAEIEHLIRMSAAKHSTGAKNPNIKIINKINPEVVPDRDCPLDITI